ncbi:MAG: DNA-directed RNA polymerase subunit omega [Candidatus Krumholzibacteriia bacterium]
MKNVVLIEKMTAVVPNKYEAIRVIAKEARRINSLLIHGGAEVEEKPTMMAMKRLLEKKIKFDYIEPEELHARFDGETE